MFILAKDFRTYYLKLPNISWGLIFPLALTGMFFIKSGSGLESISSILPGVIALSVLFGTTSLLAVTVTFEKKNRSFERLLLAKTSGAILFGVVKAFVPILMAAFLIDLDHVDWAVFLKPLSYALPLTYGADMLHGAINGGIWRSSPCSVSVYSW